MGGVYLSEGKNGGSILRCRKKWGEDTLAAEGRVYLHTPPLGVILAASLSLKYGAIRYNGLAVTSFAVLSFCTQFEQKLWFIQNVYHI